MRDAEHGPRLAHPPQGEQRELNLPTSPRRTTEMTGWQKADFIAEPGLSQPRKAGPDEAFEIRYRVLWTE